MPNLTDDEIFDGFAPWVAKQNPARRYEYGSTDNCAFAQYLKSLGYSSVRVGGYNFDAEQRYGVLPNELSSALGDNRMLGGPPSTFGELAEALGIVSV